MNNYCMRCKNLCEEIIPTYNCKFQMNNKKELTELLNEHSDIRANMQRKLDAFINDYLEISNMMYDSLDKIVNEINNTPSEVEMKIQYVQQNIGDLEFNERGAAYESEFGLGRLGEKIDNKLILVSLICSFVLAARKKDPNITVLDCVKKLTDYETLAMDDKVVGIGKYYENLAIICESFLYGVSEGNTFGLKSAADLKAKVKEILSNYTPF